MFEYVCNVEYVDYEVVVYVKLVVFKVVFDVYDVKYFCKSIK